MPLGTKLETANKAAAVKIERRTLCIDILPQMIELICDPQREVYNFFDDTHSL